MKENAILVISSLLTMFFVTFHITDDIVLGFSPGGLSNLTVIFVVVVWLYATLILSAQRWGYAINLILSLVSTCIPIVHLLGKGVGVGSRVSRSGDAVFFIWTLFALGIAALFSFVLSVRGLWRLRPLSRSRDS